MGTTSSSESGSIATLARPIMFPAEFVNRGFRKPSLLEPISVEFNGCEYRYFVVVPSTASEKAIVHCHGNGYAIDDSIIRHWMEYANVLGMVVFLVEFNGYGVCQDLGPPSAHSTQEGLSAVMKEVESQGFSSSNIYLIGYSVGTGPIACFASEQETPFARIVLIAPYRSATSVVMPFWTDNIIGFFRVGDALKKIAQRTPICLIHGIEDEVIPVKHSVTMHEEIQMLEGGNCGCELHLLPDCDHAEAGGGPRTFEIIQKFFR